MEFEWILFSNAVESLASLTWHRIWMDLTKQCRWLRNISDSCSMEYEWVLFNNTPVSAVAPTMALNMLGYYSQCR